PDAGAEVRDGRDVRQPRRPDPLAGVAGAADRLRAADGPGLVRADQAHRLPDRRRPRPHRQGGREIGRGGTGGDPAPARRGKEDRGRASLSPGEIAMEFITANFAPIMFAGLVLFLLLGFPVAFSLGAAGLTFGLIGIELGVFPSSVLAWLPQRLIGIMSNDTLLAVPFFTLMGLILERSGMAEDLLDTVGQVFGPLRGGLALAVIFVGALLAATTGVVAASVISMGLISMPIMLRYGYSRPLTSGVIAASGTLSQIIPPSLVLIVLADQMGKS